MRQNLAEKILQAHTREKVGKPGQIVRCRVDGVLANDITAPLAIASFQGMGADRVFDPDRKSVV